MYQFRQFEAVLQKIAHAETKAAVEKLQRNTRIDVSMGEIALVETDEISIRFQARISVYSRVGTTVAGLSIGQVSFTIEPKLYANSNHSTRISYYPTEGQEKQQEAKITAFIERIMAGVKPVPRFSLASVTAGKEGKPK